jgi:hypothetical protein
MKEGSLFCFEGMTSTELECYRSSMKEGSLFCFEGMTSTELECYRFHVFLVSLETTQSVGDIDFKVIFCC